MTIARKVEKKEPTLHEEDIEKVISRGGKTTAESELVDLDKELKFTLRISAGLMEEIDKLRDKETGHISRNTWILQAIQHQINTQ